MHAVRTYGPGDLRVEDVPEPQLLEPTDAIVKVTSSAICGSDLHLFHGKIPGIEAGMVCGHEFAGEVLEVGSGVLDIAAGERCVASMFSACGRCPACLRMEHRRCARFGMFGYGVAFGDLAGGQAEYVRVPFADMTLAAIPEGLSDHDVLLTSDILPTAYTALERGGAQPGDVVAVVGAGPLGQLITMCAPLFGCSTVVAIDVVPDRLKEAEALGAVPVNASSDDPFDAVYDLTNNQGADLVIEAAGNAAALETALSVVRIAGRVVMVGVLVDEPFPISAGETFLRGLSITGLVGEPLRYRADLLRLIGTRRLDPARIISHTLPLTEAVEAYRMFDAREATKVVLQP
jgi:2-desacetyl-2-hydroxyethyl bacteriochlorophyllide A dehydrogenase